MEAIRDIDEINKEYEMVWIVNPLSLPYVRESKFFCSHPCYKPIKKKDFCVLCIKGKINRKSILKLIGYSKPKKSGNGLYVGVYYWLKGYDKCMPDSSFVYGKGGVAEGLRPSEAVTFVSSNYSAMDPNPGPWCCMCPDEEECLEWQRKAKLD